ncbi:MAG: hypothetical protein R3A10_03930 [Caldilineaceae bacterium]
MRVKLAQAIHWASGATPTVLPSTEPSVWVPWPPKSTGAGVCCHGSNQL